MTTPQTTDIPAGLIGKNVLVGIEKNNLIVSIDLNQRHGRSKSDKSTIIATTEGHETVYSFRDRYGQPHKVKLNLTCSQFEPPPPDQVLQHLTDALDNQEVDGIPIPEVPTEELIRAILELYAGYGERLIRNLFPQDVPQEPEVE